MKRMNSPDKVCVNPACGKAFNRKRLVGGRLESATDYNARKYCSPTCYFEANQGENHWHFNGYLRTNRDGYLQDTRNDQLIHRQVMEAHLGRPLREDENIHHIDGNKKNNDISNLMIMSNSDHRRLEVVSQKRDAGGRFSR